jgi:hypothetical protein
VDECGFLAVVLLDGSVELFYQGKKIKRIAISSGAPNY